MQSSEYWLITEYIELGNLYEYLSHNDVSNTIAVQLMRSLTNGISYLHTEIRSGYSYKPRIVHRDIKPTNILVKSNLTCIIADFGLAIYCYYNDISHEAESQIKGTPRYCSPEKLKNTSSSKKFPSMLEQDVYSLSLVLWEICQRMDVTFDENEKLPLYKPCFYKEVSENPTVEEMMEILLKNKQRPEFSAEWMDKNKALESCVEIIKEAWHENGSVRPTALKIRNTFDNAIIKCQLNVFSV
uniref:receptor protein serine/threonine kinase n=1 Tax=Panagrolaimus superbus TaxID=310955 RepID=A0A914Z3E6_9BILA